MKVVLFDPGRTLERNNVLLPGVLQLLDAVVRLRDANDQPPVLSLVSDYSPAATDQQIAQRHQEYYAILDVLGIRSRFEPVAKHVTLSTEVGVNKPDARIFRAALDRVEAGFGFGNAIFTTERPDHVQACRDLGMQAIHFKGPGQASGEVTKLLDAIEIIKAFVEQP